GPSPRHLLAEAPEEAPEVSCAPQHFQKADGAHLRRVVQDLDAGLRHQRAAHAEKLQPGFASQERPGEVRPVEVAGGLARRQHDLHFPPDLSMPGTYETRLTPWRSA